MDDMPSAWPLLRSFACCQIWWWSSLGRVALTWLPFARSTPCAVRWSFHPASPCPTAAVSYTWGRGCGQGVKRGL